MAERKGGLGRGLAALIPSAPGTETEVLQALAGEGSTEQMGGDAFAAARTALREPGAVILVGERLAPGGTRETHIRSTLVLTLGRSTVTRHTDRLLSIDASGSSTPRRRAARQPLPRDRRRSRRTPKV